MATEVIKDGQTAIIHDSVVQQAIALGWIVCERPSNQVRSEEPHPEKPRRGRLPKVDTGD